MTYDDRIVHFDMPSGCSGSIEDGTVYVMNDKGATVATYRLGPNP